MYLSVGMTVVRRKLQGFANFHENCQFSQALFIVNPWPGMNDCWQSDSFRKYLAIIRQKYLTTYHCKHNPDLETQSVWTQFYQWSCYIRYPSSGKCRLLLLFLGWIWRNHKQLDLVHFFLSLLDASLLVICFHGFSNDTSFIWAKLTGDLVWDGRIWPFLPQFSDCILGVISRS